MTAKDTYILLLFLWVTFQVPGIHAVILQSINVAGNVTPEQSSDVGLVCKIFDFQRTDNVSIFKTASEESLSDSNKPVAVCNRAGCIAFGGNRYTYTSNSSGVYIHITALNRTMDQAWWHCTLDGQTKSLELKIYTSPTIIETHQAQYGSYDLSHDPVSIVCRTSCIYPQATSMEWYFTKPDGSQHHYPSITRTSFEVCNAWEKRQLVTLSLPINTTLPDNFEQHVQFRCAISVFPGLREPLYSGYFQGIKFAVTVDSVILYDEGKLVLPMDKITAFDGKNKTLECRLGIARPAPVIAWYIGDRIVQRSNANTFSFIAKPSDNNATIGCHAYNLQTEQSAVGSYQGILFVIERPEPPRDFRLNKLTPNSATIVWTPGHDGGMTQTFNLQYKKSSDADWITEKIEALNKTTVMITNLSPGTMYDFNVYASNIIGDSEATQPKVFATQCKDPEDYPGVPVWVWVITSLAGIETMIMVGYIIYRIRK